MAKTKKKPAASKAPKFLTGVHEYNGKHTFSIRRSEDDRFPFQFMVAKAKMILACLPAIREFVDEYGDEAK